MATTLPLQPLRPVTHRTTMRAAVLLEPGRIAVQEVAIPCPAEDEVRVRIESCGVCASNLSPWEGQPWFTYPFAPGALGHEATGTIDALGEQVTGWSVGQRVALLAYHGYAEFDLAKADALVALPPELDGADFPGEPLGCAMNIFSRSGIRRGDVVAIVGVGFLGALLVQLAMRSGAQVIAIARRESALEFAREAGAAVLPMGDQAEVIRQVQERTGGRFCDVVIEATGKQAPLSLAGELTRERGRLVIAGYHQDGPREVNMQLWNWRGLDVINAHERDPAIYVDGIRAAVTAVAAGQLDPAPLITHRFPLEQLGTALDLTRDRPEGFMKALIAP